MACAWIPAAAAGPAPDRLVSGSTARDPVDVRVAHTGLIPIDVATLIGLATVDSSHSALDGLAPSASNEALQIRDLVKRYPTGVEALRGVSLDIQRGEFFGLL